MLFRFLLGISGGFKLGADGNGLSTFRNTVYASHSRASDFPSNSFQPTPETLYAEPDSTGEGPYQYGIDLESRLPKIVSGKTK